MPEYMDDTELEETAREQKETARRKREPSMEELLRCPTNGCPGGPEVWSTGIYATGGELWCVGCPVCGGWVSQYLVPDGSDIDPYEKGTEIWLSWRKGEH